MGNAPSRQRFRFPFLRKASARRFRAVASRSAVFAILRSALEGMKVNSNLNRAQRRAMSSRERAMGAKRHSLHVGERLVTVEVLRPDKIRRLHTFAQNGDRYSHQVLAALDAIVTRVDDRTQLRFQCGACEYEFEQSQPPCASTYILTRQEGNNHAAFSIVCPACAKLTDKEIIAGYGAYAKRSWGLREL
jgi:hypothetical protein